MANQQLPNRWSRERVLFHFRRLSFNALLQIGSQVLPLIAGAVAIPFIYKNIGREPFGAFTIGLSALGLFALLDLGLGRAAVRFMARHFADNDFIAAASVAVNSGLLLGGFTLTIGVVLLATIPEIAAHWVHLPPDEQRAFVQILYILAVALPFAGLTSVFRAVLEAKENFLTISVIQVVLGISTYVLPLFLSFVTADVRLLIGASVACRIVAFFAFVTAAAAAWPSRFPWRHLNLAGQRDFRRFSLWLVISNMIGSAIVYGDRGLLVKIFGLAAIPFYNVPLEILGRLMIVVNSAATVGFPALSRASEDRTLFTEVYVSLTTLLSVVVGVALLGLSLFTPFGLNLWLGDEFRVHSTGIVRVLLVGLAFQSLNVFALASLNARGFARPITIMHLVEIPVYLWALYRCGTSWGLVGAAAVWSGRLAFEYVCFTAFQTFVGGRDGRGMRVSGALIASVNVIPLVVLAATGGRWLAIGLGASCAVVSSAWALPLARRQYVRGI